MKLQQLELTDFRPFKNLNIQFGKQLTVLVGINGAGKTSILEALAIMLSRLFSRIRSTKGTGQFTESDIRKGASKTANSIEIEFNQKPHSWKVVKTKRGRKKQTITNLTAIKDIVEQIQDSFEQNDKNSVPLAVFYGVNRAVLAVPLRIRTKHHFEEQFSAYEQALTGGHNDFRRFFEWYREREDFENEQKLYPIEPSVGDNLQYQEPQLEAVRKAILALTGFSNLRVRRSPLRMEVKKAKQPFAKLSDGEKCLLALAGDLAHRLAIANPDLSDPL
jgi:predicted ATP-binding protein involved in virulence